MELVRKEAKKNVAAKKGFYVHFGVYVIVILFLALINLLTLDDGGREWWFFYPLLGWGVGVSIHYLTVFGFPGTDILTKEWEAEEMEKEMERIIDEKQMRLSPMQDEELDLDDRLELDPRESLKKENWNREDIV